MREQFDNVDLERKGKLQTGYKRWWVIYALLTLVVEKADEGVKRYLKESESEVAQLFPTLCDPVDCSLPGSSFHGILQARILEWIAISFSRDLPDPGIEPGLPHCRQILYRLSHQGSPRDTWSNRQIWPWSTEWSKAKANKVLPRERTGDSKHPLTTQEKTVHIDITRRSILKSDWLYSLQPEMEKLYTVSKNKTGSWVARIMNSLLPNSYLNERKLGKPLDHSGMT